MFYFPSISHLNYTESTGPISAEGIVNCSRWFLQLTTAYDQSVKHLCIFLVSCRLVEMWTLFCSPGCRGGLLGFQSRSISMSPPWQPWRVILESLKWNMAERCGVLWWPKEVFWVHKKEKELRAGMTISVRVHLNSRLGCFRSNNHSAPCPPYPSPSDNSGKCTCFTLFLNSFGPKYWLCLQKKMCVF